MKVLLFSQLSDTCGFNERKFDIVEGLTVEDLIKIIQNECHFFNQLPYTLLIAVNEVYSPTDTPLKDGDVVALFPPVSGG